ncbi:hypothetical protein AB91_5583, partial [Escherichia coli 2-460-02_S3_C1]
MTPEGVSLIRPGFQARIAIRHPGTTSLTSNFDFRQFFVVARQGA